MAVVVFAACGGGGGSPPPPPEPTATPSPRPSSTPSLSPTSPPATATPTPMAIATLTPTPTNPPASPAIAIPARPLSNGDTYTYTGSSQQSLVYARVAPNPQATLLTNIVQNVTVSTGGSAPITFTTHETDTSPLARTTLTTTTNYETLPVAGSSSTDLVTTGFTSTASSGEVITETVFVPGVTNGLVDVLPEMQGMFGANSGAMQITQAEADGFHATRTYQPDGTYTETASYPLSSSNAPQQPPFTTTITTQTDGSAIYDFGSQSLRITAAAPDATGNILITVTNQADGHSFSPGPIARWYQLPITLYSELDRDNGAVAVPTACNVSATYGTTANQIEARSTRVDPALGTLESLDQLTYVTPKAGAVCVTLSDTILTYYDLSGQGNDIAGFAFSGGNYPLETETLSTTLGLTTENIASFARRRAIDNTQGTFRLASARASFLTLLEHRRVARERHAVESLLRRYSAPSRSWRIKR